MIFDLKPAVCQILLPLNLIAIAGQLQRPHRRMTTKRTHYLKFKLPAQTLTQKKLIIVTKKFLPEVALIKIYYKL